MTNDGWKRNALLLGGIIGAVIGVVAAQMLVRQAEASGEQKPLSTGKGLQIGVLVLGLLRQLLSL